MSRSVGRARLTASHSALVRSGAEPAVAALGAPACGGPRERRAAARLVSYGCAPSGTGSVRGFLTRHPASAEKAGHPDRPPSGLFRPLPSPSSSRAKGRPRRLSQRTVTLRCRSALARDPATAGHTCDNTCRSAPCARPVIAYTVARKARSYKGTATFGEAGAPRPRPDGSAPPRSSAEREAEGEPNLRSGCTA